MHQADLIFAAGESSADILYASGFQAPDPFIYFAFRNEKAIIVSALEQDRAEKECKPEIAVLERNSFLRDKKSKNIDVICSLAESRGIDGFRVPADFPLALADELRERGLTVEADTGVFYPQRQYKDGNEIKNLKTGVQIAEAGMRRALYIIKESAARQDGMLEYKGETLTSEFLRSEINITMIKLGGFSDSTIAACGADAAEPHNTGTGALYAGKTIILDIFPRIRQTGYWGDLTRTVVKGKSPEIVKKAYKAVFEAREYAKTLIKPGAVPSGIHQAAVKILDKHGFNTGRQNGRNFGFFHSLGHSVGLEIHEKPNLSPFNDEPLKGGEVLTVEPGLYYPEWGGVRLEDVVTVTSDGCRCLTEIENILEI
jgi:Xaa-Pro aminopeptidase